MDTKEDTKRRSRRRHDDGLKQRVIAECEVPGASVAQVALSHGLNANLVHKWRRTAGARDMPAAAFMPVAVAAATVEPEPFAEIELQRGALSVRVRWPTRSASSCAAWLREILR